MPAKRMRLSASIGEQKKTDDDIKEGFAFDVERDILDYNSGGYNFVVNILAKRGGLYGSCSGGSTVKGRVEMTHWGRASRGRKVRVVVGRQRTMVCRGFQPLLQEIQDETVCID
jgi:hypothetical protein